MKTKWLALAALAAAALSLHADQLSERDRLRQVPAKAFPGRVHLLPATLDTVQWGWFDNAQPPVLTIRSGDTVVMETMMHSHNQIVPGVTIEEIRQLRLDHPGRGPHSVTGPVYVEGAEPGDVLKVRINRIVPRAYGTNFNIPGMFGEFPNEFPDGQVRYFYLDLKRMATEFAPGIEVPLRPFPGTLGVARAEPGKYSTVPPGRYAGNMDIRELVEGTTLYVRVFVPGALLWSGDSHAAQGNGEVNLTALETAFKELSLTVEVLKGISLEWPRIETPAHWITMGYDKDLNVALEILRNETAAFVGESRKLDADRTQVLVRKVSDCRIAEVVNVTKGVYCMNPKNAAVSGKPPRPTKETPHEFVTWAEDADLNRAMDAASIAMIELLQARKGLARLDAYGLASMTMDCRLGDPLAEPKRVHCLVPKSLWKEQH
jgi:acetamidase/formamidase